MRASPPFQILLRRSSVWHIALFTLAALGVAIVSAWLSVREQRPDAVVLIAAGVGVCLVVAFAVSLSRVGTVFLRWDGQVWRTGPIDTAVDDLITGDLMVVIDLGSWMLLRFEPAVRKRFEGSIFIPAQRSNVAGHWHSLRCAAYSTRAHSVGAADLPRES